MAIYWDLLSAARDVLRELPGFNQAGIAVPTFKIRKQPKYVREQDSDVEVITACREDLAERIRDETFENGVLLTFEVFVGICVLARWDEAILRWRLERREEIRLALWDPAAITVEGLDITDCQYEANPPAPQGQDTRDESWQRFDYTVSTTRTTVWNR